MFRILMNGNAQGYYDTKQAALRAGKRLQRRTHAAVSVVWCRDGEPKIWLAEIAIDGAVTFTAYWNV